MDNDPTVYINCRREIMVIPDGHCVFAFSEIDRMQDSIDALDSEVRRLKHKINNNADFGDKLERETC